FIMSYENEGFSENVRIENSLLQDINSPRDADGIKLQQIGKNSNIRISNCSFINNKNRAVKVQTNNVKIIGNKIKRSENYKNGLAIFSIYGDNVEVDSNSSYSEGNSSVNMFVDISAVKNIKISNNKHEN